MQRKKRILSLLFLVRQRLHPPADPLRYPSGSLNARQRQRIVAPLKSTRVDYNQMRVQDAIREEERELRGLKSCVVCLEAKEEKEFPEDATQFTPCLVCREYALEQEQKRQKRK